MRVAIVGGKLQGVEACYLARRAGWEVILIDKNLSVPARGLCDTFHCHDVAREPEKLSHVLRDVDLVIPALEDEEAILCLAETSKQTGIPLAFDPDAYAITSSKRKSDDLFCHLGLLAPRSWPECDLPVVVKPVGSSGSRGVTRIEVPETLDRFIESNQAVLGEWVIQEYLDGPSYSIEAMGLDGQCVTLQTTALEMDAVFDCKRVLAPVDLPASLDQELRAMTGTLASELGLTGIMDVEVIHHNGRLKILEIDARLPSQTPTAVERSTGINMLKLLGDVFIGSRLPDVSMPARERGVVYEHVCVREKRLEVLGEHIMAEADPLHIEEGFFGADLAVTDFSSRDLPWVATLIVSDATREKAWDKRCRIVESIMETCRLSGYEDMGPH